MQLTTFLSAASALVATASARSAVTANKECNLAKAHARIINRCDYPVNIWSVFKGDGCPSNEMVTLKKGEIYKENLMDPIDGKTGVSVKISKTSECKGNDIVQLEYFLQRQQPGFNFNYLDVSYVDCLGGDCPTKQEGYYLKAGSQTGEFASSASNTWCPILACTDEVSCAKMSYILPDDVQTKTCDLEQNMDFYMCGGHAPTDDDSSPASSSASSAVASTPVSSAKKVESSTPAPKPSTTLSKAVSSSAAYKAIVAAVTVAPEVKDAAAKTPKVKTKVVYVTAYEYVNAKRHEHAHAHARRHQPFNA